MKLKLIGYLVSFSNKNLDELNQKTNLTWSNQCVANTHKNSTDIFWSQSKAVFNAHCLIIDLAVLNVDTAHQLAIAWTLNYIRKINHKNNFKNINTLYDKFHFPAKTVIIVKNNKNTNKYIEGCIKDVGILVKNLNQAIRLINSRYP
ncbi:MAG: hypothetical protein LBT77_01170 [Mycoplasmataceae bacterium]|jgi:hypothetical protein|nr:hypothetical protein [Mycoplasmataceae bacterium]